MTDDGSPVLVVDDDPDVRELVAMMLEESGYLVLQADRPSQALAIIDAEPKVKVMVSDVRMPEMSGIELADIACARNASLRVVLISAYVPPTELPRTFLRKPFRRRELEAAVRSAMEAWAH
jgi:CheY-like chemotaxis protein